MNMVVGGLTESEARKLLLNCGIEMLQRQAGFIPPHSDSFEELTFTVSMRVLGRCIYTTVIQPEEWTCWTCVRKMNDLLCLHWRETGAMMTDSKTENDIEVCCICKKMVNRYDNPF